MHCAKSVRIRSYSGPHFPTFWLNTDQGNLEYEHFLRSDGYRDGKRTQKKLESYYFRSDFYGK